MTKIPLNIFLTKIASVYRPFALLLGDWACRKTVHKHRQKTKTKIARVQHHLTVLAKDIRQDGHGQKSRFESVSTV